MTALSTGAPMGPGPSIRARAARSRPVMGMLEAVGRRLVRAALTGITPGIRLIDERGRTEHEPEGGRSAATVRVADASFYSSVAFGGSLGAAEAYIDGAWTTDNLPVLVETLTSNPSAMAALEGPFVRALSPFSWVACRLERRTRSGSRRNIAAHYDLGNEFFGLFLDPTMMYSCGIFENGATTLEQAQVEKIDRACRKLRLGPRDHLLEIGTGWGALAIHASARYGCRVTTTTISAEQHRFASSRVREAGLADRVEVLRADYRDLKGKFDKIVSIEMIEAVGAKGLSTYFDICSGLLKPEGAALVQSIVIRDQFFRAAARRQDFLKRYVFPGSCLPSVVSIANAVGRWSDLRLCHMEDIGPHYATTLRLWREAFMARLDDVRAMGFDERFIRMWEYYLSYCEGAFLARHVGDVQVLLAKPMCRMPPSGPLGGTA